MNPEQQMKTGIILLDSEGSKTNGKAVIIANKTLEGLSLIDIQVYADDGRLVSPPTKQEIDDINATPFLDRQSLKNLVAQKYGLRQKDVTFYR